MHLAVHGEQEIALDLTHAVLGGHRTAHGGNLTRPRAEQVLARGKIGLVPRQNVHVQMVVPNVPPRGRFQPGLGQCAPVQVYDIVQALVWHRHV